MAQIMLTGRKGTARRRPGDAQLGRWGGHCPGSLLGWVLGAAGTVGGLNPASGIAGRACAGLVQQPSEGIIQLNLCWAQQNMPQGEGECDVNPWQNPSLGRTWGC